MIELTNGAAGHTTTPPPRTGTARHGPDFRSVNWFGTEYTFTPTQAAIVRQLWQAWENGTPDVGNETLLDGAGAETPAVSDLFRGHPAWKTVIISPAKGLYRLAFPEDAQPDAPASIESPPAPLPMRTPPPPAPAVDVVGLLVQLLGEPKPLDLSLTVGGWRLTVRLAPGAAPLIPIAPRPVVTGCRTDILDVLRRAGHRLTTNQVLDALEREGMIHGETTVKLALADMVRGGLLTKDARAEPKGYGLA